MTRPIVFVTAYYPPFGAGGAEVTTSLHAGILARAGRRVIVVTPDYGASPVEIEGVEVIRFPLQRLAGPGAQVPARVFRSPAVQRAIARRIVAALAGRSVLCLHSQNSPSHIVAARAARALGVPLVTHVRDTSAVCSLGGVCMLEPAIDVPPESCGVTRHAACYLTRTIPAYHADAPLWRKAAGFVGHALPHVDWRRQRRVHRSAARIAFASDAMCRMYAGLAGFSTPDRMKVVYAPVVDEPMSDEIPDAVRRIRGPKVLYVGKASPGKGVDVMFAAHRRVPEAHLVIAGNIDEGRWDFDRQRTTVLGFVPRAKVHALYRACDLVVLPSTWPEPLGWSTLDAGRHAKPIVATRVGGIPEAVIDGVSGILVPKLDAAAMAGAMVSILRDPKRAKAMGEAGRRHVQENFGPRRVGEQLEALYAGLG